MFYLALYILNAILVILSITSLPTADTQVPLSRDQLMQKYGQFEILPNDTRNCNRKCDGATKFCYFNFEVKMYDTMSGMCKNCADGEISDCLVRDCVPGNGVARSLMSINHKLPGPPINVCEGDRVIVDVNNCLDGSGLTLHWHGLFQQGTPYMDGVSMLTQCPIASGSTFRYDFVVQQSGTFFQHAHSGLHRTNGVFGIFNVRTHNDLNADSYDIDLSANTIFVADWNNELGEELAPGVDINSHMPASILINGLGSCLHTETGNYTFVPLAVFYAQRGKRNLFRFVNGRVHSCPSDLSIENHDLTVIATDGNAIEPVVVDSIMSTPGERYDFVITGPTDPNINETLLTIQLLDACLSFQRQEFARIIFVDDINNITTSFEHHEPLKTKPTFRGIDYSKRILNNHLADCTNPNSYCVASLKSKQSSISPIKNLRNVPAKVIPLKFRLMLGQDRSQTYMTLDSHKVTVSTINGISNLNFPAPPLIQDISNVPLCNQDQMPDYCTTSDPCHCNHLIELEMNDVYEIQIFDHGDRTNDSHPAHLHGYAFQVIDMGTKAQFESGESGFATATHLPVQKDTVTVPPGGFVTVRFEANNPGYWFFHCHYEYHMWSGMTLTFKVGKDNDLPPIPLNTPTCGDFLPPIYEPGFTDEPDNFEPEREVTNHFDTFQSVQHKLQDSFMANPTSPVTRTTVTSQIDKTGGEISFVESKDFQYTRITNGDIKYDHEITLFTITN